MLDIEQCLSTLRKLRADPELQAAMPEPIRIELLQLCGQLARPSPVEKRNRKKSFKQMGAERRRSLERQARNGTGIRLARQAPIFAAPARLEKNSTGLQGQIPEGVQAPLIEIVESRRHKPVPAQPNCLLRPRNCYICKKLFTEMHFFYDALCPECAAFNYHKRFEKADLQGQIALVTGARVKIGFQTILKLLRCGATVIATTRFPVDAALRYSQEQDFSDWSGRLHIHGLDLRHIPSVEIFADYLESSLSGLDLLINNAAQTVRRPLQFYAHLMEREKSRLEDLPDRLQKLLGDRQFCLSSLALSSTIEQTLPETWHGNARGVGLRNSAALALIPFTHDDTASRPELFPEGRLDSDLQQVDLRDRNSWRLRLGEIETAEMLELQLINAVAPFVLCNRLVKIMRRKQTNCKHIVNVSAMEGKFYRFKKADRHPHTNMAKAALNMLTHTSASDLARTGIFMNAVDTGWVTDEDPAWLVAKKRAQHDFQPPLDIVDGAARVLDPYISGLLSGKQIWGKFLKDYRPIDW